MVVEELARRLAREHARFLGWLKERRCIIYAKDRSLGEKAAEYVKRALESMGFDTEKFTFEIREPKEELLGGDTLIHAWLGRRKMREPALHVYVGPFEGHDRFGGVIYKKLASGVPLMGTLVIHQDYIRSEELNPHILQLIIHELGHVIAGLQHEHARRLGIMNPVRPKLDENSKRFFRAYLKELEKIHGTQYLKREKKPWWKFW